MGEGIKNIEWTPSGKVRKVTKSTGSPLVFRYDASGNRVEKKQGANVTRYIRDASGNVMAVYQADTLSERPIYGSSRLGNLSYASKPGYRTVGHKQYELSNHLGNVLAVVSDRIHMRTDSTWAEVISRTDYYPFGLEMAGRTESGGYRYGFNTQEKVDEIAGAGNHTTALYWEYNTRLGRRWNQDPKPNPSISNYASFANNPILYSDHLGDTTSFINKITGEVHGVNDGFTTSVNVSDNLFNRIKEGNFTNPVEHKRYGRGGQGNSINWKNNDYLKLLFEGVSMEISEKNDLSLFEKFKSIYGKNFFINGLNASFSDADVQNSDLSPTARSAGNLSRSINLGLKAVLWRDAFLQPNGLSNENQHQMASAIMTWNSMAIGSLTITTANEVLNLRRDFGSGNVKNALLGRPANTGGSTAFEWKDLSNNVKGIWKSWRGF